MALISEADLDPTQGGSGVITEADLDPIGGSVRPGDVAARQAQINSQVAAAPENVARERQSFTGEVGGGLKQFAGDISTALNPAEKDMGVVERALHVARAPLGLLRSAAPIATLGLSPWLTNLITKGAEQVHRYTPDVKIPGTNTTLSDVLGGAAMAAGDVLSQMGLTKAAGAAQGKLAARYPTLNEKFTSMVGDLRTKDAVLNAEMQARKDAARRAKSLTETSVEDVTTAAEKQKGILSAEHEAALARNETAADAARAQAQTAARQGQGAVPTPATLNALTKGSQASSKEIGADFQTLYSAKREASSASFKPKFDAIEAKAEALPGKTDHYDAALTKVQNEGAAVTGILPTAAERNAVAAQKSLIAGSEAKPAVTVNGKDLILEKRRLSKIAAQSNDANMRRQYTELADAVEKDIQALPDKALLQERAALNSQYAKEHVPFFDEKSDLFQATQVGPEAVVDKLIPKGTDAFRGEKIDNLRTLLKSEPAAQEAVGTALIKNLVGDATDVSGNLNLSKLPSNWKQYASSRDNDHVLRTVLGNRYEGMKAVAQAAERSTPSDIEGMLKEAINGINRTYKARASAYSGEFTQRIGGLEKGASAAVKAGNAKLSSLQEALGEGAQVVEGFKIPAKTGGLETERLTRIASLRKEFNDNLQKMGLKPQQFDEKGGFVNLKDTTGKPVYVGHQFSEDAGQMVGSAMVLHGAVGAAAGKAAIAGAQALSGFGVMLTAPAFFKLISTARGASLVARSVRAAPGTSAAFSAARLIKDYVKTDEFNGR